MLNTTSLLFWTTGIGTGQLKVVNWLDMTFHLVFCSVVLASHVSLLISTFRVFLTDIELTMKKQCL